MARKSSSTAVQEELYPLPSSRDDGRDPYSAERDIPSRERFDESRLVDLETEQESPFLRGQKRVSVRRGSLPKNAASGLKWTALALLIFAVFAAFGTVVYRYGKHSWRFRIDSSDQIEVLGAQHATRAQIMDVMGGDIGRNIFFVPLAQRQTQLQQIPWVESASVMRFVPNRLRIEIHERTPVAFARIGSHISLIDAGGNLMELSSGPKHTGASSTPSSGAMSGKYSFPVITGMNQSEPLSTRAARMKNYNELMRQLDAGGARYSQEISEVDLNDPEDVKVMTADSNGGVLVHLGNGNYLQRYKVYVTHMEAWRQQFEKLESVDLRYDGQIIVNPDLHGLPRQPALTPAAAKAALAAGVKNAAIVNYEKYVAHPVPLIGPPKPAPTKSKATAPSSARAMHKPRARAHAKATPHHAPPKARASAAVAHPAVPSNAVVPATSKSPLAASSKPAGAVSAPAAPNPVRPALSPPATVAGTQKKPSAAIPKETPQN